MATRKPTSVKKTAKKTSRSTPAKSTKTTKAARPASPAKRAPAKAKAAPKKAAAKTAQPKTSTRSKAASKVKKDEGAVLAASVVRGILEKKGENIVCLDLRKIENAVCDYFIICEANSNIQVEAIADSVETTVKKELGQRPYRSEGWENALWILVDYINVVVHVFERETRQFYNLESLWADAEEVDFEKKRA